MVTWIFGVLFILSLFFNILLCFRLFFRTYDGEIVIWEQDGKTTFSLDLDVNPDDISDMEDILFKVVDSHEKHPL